MNPNAHVELSSAAASVLAAVGVYQERWRSCGRDALRYSEAQASFDELRRHVSALPQASVRWVEVLITRFELAEALWRSKAAPNSPSVVRLEEAHARALEQLRAQAEQYLRQ